MGSCKAWASAVTLATICSLVTAQYVPSWVGQAGDGGSTAIPDWAAGNPGAYARDNPFGLFSVLAKMPAEEQRTYLKAIGQNLQNKYHSSCNAFGGADSCMELPSESKFAQVCREHDLKVDCAYYQDDLQEINDDPSADLRQALQDAGMADLESSCEACFDNQRQMWCAQTVPKCGSFAALVETAILPAIAQVVNAEADEASQIEALSSAVPMLLKAMSLSLPCREMCEAVVNTCSCKKDRTFGELLDKIVAKHTDAEAIPPGFTQQLFGPVYDQPLCSLYASKTDEGFAGHCMDLAATCSDEARWCHGENDASNPGPDLVEELMALQLAKGLFGWTGSPTSGLLLDEQTAVDNADSADEKALEEKYLVAAGSTPKSSSSSGSHAWVIVLVVCLVTGFVAAGGFAYWRWRQSRNAGFARFYEQTYSPLQPDYLPPGGTSETQLS
ncbi:hypothetical protein WJX72_008541 [[Myrmecia] bisecta]|uniref:Uncharacterized protein n=1 Tax=[Myrmecia] bisecta TaxID=41462 RepID=A0AAW1R8C5_9CHLO